MLNLYTVYIFYVCKARHGKEFRTVVYLFNTWWI